MLEIHRIFKLKMYKMDWLKPALSTYWQYYLEVNLERWIIKFGSLYGLSSNRATVLPSDSFLIASLGRVAKKCTQHTSKEEANLVSVINDNGR